MANSVMRFPRVREVTGLSRSSVWRLEDAGDFPKRIQLSANSVGWREDEILAWINGRNRGQGITPQRKSDEPK